MTLPELRAKHPRFIYESYSEELLNPGVRLTFSYLLEPGHRFTGDVIIHDVQAKEWESIPQAVRDEWVFHIGLAEMPSYWKAAAPQEIVIKAGWLSESQLQWWHNVFIQGMGEYFYINQIDFTAPDFLKLSVEGSEEQHMSSWDFTTSTDYLVPIGGGKDSSLTLALLNENNIEFGVFLLNPTQAALDVTLASNPRQTLTARRTIDPNLLALNTQGYLNGHVPFSAYLAFLSRFTATLFGYRSVVISNERSSNEGNVQFLGHEINHQYSKTFEFEQLFEKYLHQSGLQPQDSNNTPSFFSLLRPLFEVQISKMLSERSSFAAFAPVMRSCNRGQRSNSWCGECPKCLFAFTALYPFVDHAQLIAMFGKNLFDDAGLIDEARALLGVADTKPFECVGTHEENKVAFYLAMTKIRARSTQVPVLLQLVWDQVISAESDMAQRAQAILSSWNPDHQVPPHLEEILRHALSTT
jgi:UDP-N-acetyl-alpha-D-muramoyl-L-alanyl-L-glutamate epimerase